MRSVFQLLRTWLVTLYALVRKSLEYRKESLIWILIMYMYRCDSEVLAITDDSPPGSEYSPSQSRTEYIHLKREEERFTWKLEYTYIATHVHQRWSSFRLNCTHNNYILGTCTVQYTRLHPQSKCDPFRSSTFGLRYSDVDHVFSPQKDGHFCFALWNPIEWNISFSLVLRRYIFENQGEGGGGSLNEKILCKIRNFYESSKVSSHFSPR